MKLRILACAAIVGCALGATSAMAQSEAQFAAAKQNTAVSLHSFVETWQKRILAQNLPVADPMNWGVRSLPKLAAFSADRLDMAMRATTIGELEAMFVTAPISHGTRMKTLLDAKPGNVSTDALTSRTATQLKSTDPAASPGLYDDLVFTVVNPCRMYDSRLTQGGAGPFLNGSIRQIKIGPYASGYQTGAGAQGGAATSCGLDTLSAGDGIAAVMVAVSSFSQTGPGYLTFFSYGSADPSATVVSMFYTAGPVQTAFVLIPTDMQIPVWAKGVSRGADTEVTIDVVGYFETPKALDCVVVQGVDTVLPASSSGTNANAPSCATGYRQTAIYCVSNSYGSSVAGWAGQNVNNACYFKNNIAGSATIRADIQCCKLPGGR